ncbi:diacylglycerol/lipid kinase family protein [Streptomyces sp. NPDC059994]|uniref:diacylglycerol/lipid kinase family protein n=1 Tax=Streptomyces sp. NPDC059994 TaxID=3347029 RepID=UPI003678EC01
MSPSPKSVLVVANPAAGTYSREMAHEVARRIAGAGTPVELAVTERPGHAQQLARTAGGPGGPAVLVCVGGDGTAHEIMTGLLAGREEPRAALLVLPGGRGNSFYQELWSDRPWPAALEAALSAPHVRRVDLARIAETGELALLGASSGLAAQALTSVRDALGPGRRRYQTAVARTMIAFRPYRGRVSVDGVVVQSGATVSVLVGGGRRRGGQFMPLPRSVLDDGLLDICVAGAELPLRDMVRLARDGSHVGRDGMVYARGRRVVVERTDGEPLFFEHDGDLLYTGSARYTLDVVPRALPVLAP